MILYEQVAVEYPGTNAGYIGATTVDAARATRDDAPPPRSQAPTSRDTTRSSGAAPSSSPSSRAGNSRSSSARSSEDSNRTAGTLKEGSVFPDFNVQDIDNTPLSLSQFAGKIVLIDFWAAYNEESVSNIDAKMSIYRRYHGKGFEIIGINRDRSRAPMINFLN